MNTILYPVFFSLFSWGHAQICCSTSSGRRIWPASMFSLHRRPWSDVPFGSWSPLFSLGDEPFIVEDLGATSKYSEETYTKTAYYKQVSDGLPSVDYSQCHYIWQIGQIFKEIIKEICTTLLAKSMKNSFFERQEWKHPVWLDPWLGSLRTGWRNENPVVVDYLKGARKTNQDCCA